jgi:hypothetical protein
MQRTVSGAQSPKSHQYTQGPDQASSEAIRKPTCHLFYFFRRDSLWTIHYRQQYAPQSQSMQRTVSGAQFTESHQYTQAPDQASSEAIRKPTCLILDNSLQAAITRAYLTRILPILKSGKYRGNSLINVAISRTDI